MKIRNKNKMENISLPKKSIKYILFQRTEYLKDNYLFKFLTLLGYFKSFYKLSINLKSFIFSSKIKREFSKDMEREYLTIKKYLPKKANSILDIGCGIAGIDIFLSNHYKKNIDIFLLDKTIIHKKGLL